MRNSPADARSSPASSAANSGDRPTKAGPRAMVPFSTSVWQPVIERNQQLVLRVEDDGVGLSPDTRFLSSPSGRSTFSTASHRVTGRPLAVRWTFLTKVSGQPMRPWPRFAVCFGPPVQRRRQIRSQRPRRPPGFEDEQDRAVRDGGGVTCVLSDDDPVVRAGQLYQRVVRKVLCAELGWCGGVVAQGVEKFSHRRRQHGVDQELQARSRSRSAAIRSASASARSLTRTRSSISSR